MPMWQYNRKPSPPPRVVHTPVAVEVLSAGLTDAIMADDMAAARQVFDRAFWDKVKFRPDGYHLLQAVKRDNRDMVKLLITHGAAWTPEENKIARLLIGQERWRAADGLLRQCGIRTQFADAELRDVDPVAATVWARRSVEEAERRRAPDAGMQRCELERVMTSGIVLLMKSGNTGKALEMLLARDKKFGAGSPLAPLDVSREFGDMVTLEPQAPSTALRFLDALKKRGLAVKPLKLSTSLMMFAPSVLKEVDARGLLSDAQTDERMALAWNWAAIQPKIDTGIGGVIELDPAYVEDRHVSLAKAAKLLFRADKPASEEEAEYFVSMHESRAKMTPYALERMEKELLALGFFDSTAFTVKHLEQLARTAPQGDDFREHLSDSFNRLAAARKIAQFGADKFLSSAKFHEIETAHRLRAWKANAAETVKIVDYLFSQVKKDAVPDTVVAALITLRDGGADFSRVDPMRYLGKKAPGLCKTLLDANIVSARGIDLDLLARRSGGELRPLTPKTAEGYADQEFMCQIVLESFAPDKFIPLRGQQEVSYQREFLREYTANPQMKRRFMAGRIHAPKP